MKNVKWILLLIFSLAFYALIGTEAFLFCLAISLLVWVIGLFMETSKNRTAPMIIGIGVVMALWTIQKINLISAMGLAFYSLQAIGYLVDLKNEKFKAESNPLKFLLFMCYFPLSLQGPICRYDELMPRLLKVRTREEKMTSRNFSRGMTRTVFGLFKKLVIADRLASITDGIFMVQQGYTGLWVIFGLLIYSVRIYNDFTGGIDLIMGLSETMGIELPENFNKPLTARTLSEYWTKWHITLASWFKNYVFYPLSVGLAHIGMKSKNAVIVISMAVTWSLVGVWHGLSLKFLVWGLINAAILLLPELTGWKRPAPVAEGEKYKPIDYLCMVRTFALVSFLRIFDVYGSISEGFGALAGFNGMTGWGEGFALFGLGIDDYIILVVAVLLVALLMKLSKSAHVADSKLFASDGISMAFCVIMIVITVVFAKYGREYNAGAFIYGNFI